MRLEAKGSWLLSLALLGNLVGCGGSSKSNQGFDTSLNDGPDSITDEAFKNARDKWKTLAASLGIGNNEAASPKELTSSLKTPSSVVLGALTDPTALNEINKKVAAEFASKAYASKCASVESFTEWTDRKAIVYNNGTEIDYSSKAKVYLLKYKLFGAAGTATVKGTAESNTRTGLVVIPTGTPVSTTTVNPLAGGAYPIVAYAHGGDAGLSYTGDIAKLFATFQSGHIIVAPTFPGEALCNAGLDTTKRSCDSSGNKADAVGTSLPWDNDVDELLGMHDCVARVARDANSAGNVPSGVDGAGVIDLKTALTGKTAKLSTSNALTAYAPASIVVGASRGGLVAQLALARVGAQASGFSEAYAKDNTTTWENVYGLGYGKGPSYFNCALTVSSPTTMTHARPRIALEYLVKGTFESSPLYALPGFHGMKDIFTPYLNGDKDLAYAQMEVYKRDIAFIGPLALGGLKKWQSYSTTTPGGAYGTLHSTADKVYGYGEAVVGFNALALFSTVGAVQDSTKIQTTAPWKMYGRLFEPVTYDAKDTYHANDAFLASESITPQDYILLVAEKPLATTPLNLEGLALTMASLAYGVNVADLTDIQKKVGRTLFLSGTSHSDSLTSLSVFAGVSDTTAATFAGIPGWTVNIKGTKSYKAATTFGGTALADLVKADPTVDATQYVQEQQADGTGITPLEAFATWRLNNSRGCSSVLP